jgi:hypothetical protein
LYGGDLRRRFSALAAKMAALQLLFRDGDTAGVQSESAVCIKHKPEILYPELVQRLESRTNRKSGCPKKIAH